MSYRTCDAHISDRKDTINDNRQPPSIYSAQKLTQAIQHCVCSTLNITLSMTALSMSSAHVCLTQTDSQRSLVITVSVLPTCHATPHYCHSEYHKDGLCHTPRCHQQPHPFVSAGHSTHRSAAGHTKLPDRCHDRCSQPPVHREHTRTYETCSRRVYAYVNKELAEPRGDTIALFVHSTMCHCHWHTCHLPHALTAAALWLYINTPQGGGTSPVCV